jgi:hypothetical protein
MSLERHFQSEAAALAAYDKALWEEEREQEEQKRAVMEPAFRAVYECLFGQCFTIVAVAQEALMASGACPSI